MNAQTHRPLSRPVPSALQTLRAGRVVPLGAAGGRLDVLHGRVWLTREGELDDHLVEAGESFDVPANGQAVVEAWDDADPALIAWRAGTLLDRVAAFARDAFGGPEAAFLHNTAVARRDEGISIDAVSAHPGRARGASPEAGRRTAVAS